eukprot:COSAG01_NODE_2065_length_8507_cov_67.737274_2_plen_298_part_00
MEAVARGRTTGGAPSCRADALVPVERRGVHTPHLLHSQCLGGPQARAVVVGLGGALEHLQSVCSVSAHNYSAHSLGTTKRAHKACAQSVRMQCERSECEHQQQRSRAPPDHRLRLAQQPVRGCVSAARVGNHVKPSCGGSSRVWTARCIWPQGPFEWPTTTTTTTTTTVASSASSSRRNAVTMISSVSVCWGDGGGDNLVRILSRLDSTFLVRVAGCVNSRHRPGARRQQADCVTPRTEAQCRCRFRALIGFGTDYLHITMHTVQINARKLAMRSQCLVLGLNNAVESQPDHNMLWI